VPVLWKFDVAKIKTRRAARRSELSFRRVSATTKQREVRKMIQAKSFTVTGSTGVRNRVKETTLAADVDKVLNDVLEELGDKFKSYTISPLGSALPDSVLVTVLYEAEAKKKTQK
jgi:hypothetical protein